MKISDKAESKGQDCPKLVTHTRTDPKNKMHELTLYLAEQGGQRVEQRKCSLRPESRGTGKRIITRRSQKQTLVLVNMFRQKRYGSKSLLPKADGALSLFLLSLLSFFPAFFLFAFGWLFNKRYIKSTALKMCLHDECLQLGGREELQRPCLMLSTKDSTGVS